GTDEPRYWLLAPWACERGGAILRGSRVVPRRCFSPLTKFGQGRYLCAAGKGSEICWNKWGTFLIAAWKSTRSISLPLLTPLVSSTPLLPGACPKSRRRRYWTWAAALGWS